MDCGALWGVLQSPRVWDTLGYVGCCGLLWVVWGTVWCATGTVGHWYCVLRGMQSAQSPPHNPVDKSIVGVLGAEEKPTPRCRLCPLLASQCVPHTGVCLTLCLAHLGQPHGSHSHIWGQWTKWVTHEGPCQGPIPAAPQDDDAAWPLWGISQCLRAVLVTSQHPGGWVTCQPPDTPGQMGTWAGGGWCGGRQGLCSRAAANVGSGSCSVLAQGLLHRLI